MKQTHLYLGPLTEHDSVWCFMLNMWAIIFVFSFSVCFIYMSATVPPYVFLFDSDELVDDMQSFYSDDAQY